MLRYPEPTAEQVVQSVEAAYLLGDQADLGGIAGFMALDITVPHQRQQVENSILAAEMLNLATPRRRRQNVYEFSVLVPLIVKSKDEDKRVFFRTHLDQFEPFRLLAERLRTGISPQEAARQVCAVRDFADDPVVAWRAFESWGTYARSLIRAENGQYVPTHLSETPHLLCQSLDNLTRQDQDARQFILEQLGQEAYEFIEGNIRDSLSDATVMIANNSDPRQVVLQLGNTYEDFLRLIGFRRVNLRNAHGIIQVGNQLRTNHLLAQKHLGAIQLIGQIRNAADHGGDPDEGNRRWQIAHQTTHLMALAMLSSIRSITCYRRRSVLEL
jgi:hypothetical protein